VGSRQKRGWHPRDLEALKEIVEGQAREN